MHEKAGLPGAEGCASRRRCVFTRAEPLSDSHGKNPRDTAQASKSTPFAYETLKGETMGDFPRTGEMSGSYNSRRGRASQTNPRRSAWLIAAARELTPSFRYTDRRCAFNVFNETN